MNRDPRVLLAEVVRAGADIQRYTVVMERVTYLRNRTAEFFDEGISFDRSLFWSDPGIVHIGARIED